MTSSATENETFWTSKLFLAGPLFGGAGATVWTCQGRLPTLGKTLSFFNRSIQCFWSEGNLFRTTRSLQTALKIFQSTVPNWHCSPLTEQRSGILRSFSINDKWLNQILTKVSSLPWVVMQSARWQRVPQRVWGITYYRQRQNKTKGQHRQEGLATLERLIMNVLSYS